MKKEVYHKMYEREDIFWWHAGMKEIATVFLNSHLKNLRGNTILDVGCGTGGMLKTLSEYGNVSGVDSSDEAVIYAKKRNIGTVIKNDIALLPFVDSSFDLVTCFDVLHHRFVKDDVSALSEIARTLKSGGMLLIREPAFDWLRGNHDKIVWTKHRYTMAELKNKIESVGLTVRKASYANCFLFPIVLITRLFESVFHKEKDIDGIFLSNSFVNRILKQFLSVEAALLKYIDFPFGSSVICIAIKK